MMSATNRGRYVEETMRSQSAIAQFRASTGQTQEQAHTFFRSLFEQVRMQSVQGGVPGLEVCRPLASLLLLSCGWRAHTHTHTHTLWLHCCGYTAMAACSTADTMPRQCPFAP